MRTSREKPSIVTERQAREYRQAALSQGQNFRLRLLLPGIFALGQIRPMGGSVITEQTLFTDNRSKPRNQSRAIFIQFPNQQIVSLDT